MLYEVITGEGEVGGDRVNRAKFEIEFPAIGLIGIDVGWGPVVAPDGTGLTGILGPVDLVVDIPVKPGDRSKKLALQETALLQGDIGVPAGLRLQAGIAFGKEIVRPEP